MISATDFKTMCRILKVFPVVVSEETVDKVIEFCVKKNVQVKGSESQGRVTGATLFEFGDFIRSFKVSCFLNHFGGKKLA